MGKLRFEPKVKPPVDREEYQTYKDILLKALPAAGDNNVYYDLEKGEKLIKVRKALQYIAEREGIDLSVRAKRGENTLSLKFGAPAKSGTGRISAKDSRNRIVSVLSGAKTPMQKSDIIAAAGVSPSTWNLRIKELLDDRTVKRHGTGRQTAYSLASKK
jgi:hypothetical protein